MSFPQEGCKMVNDISSSLSMYTVAELDASRLAGSVTLSCVEVEERDVGRIESYGVIVGIRG